MTPIRTRVTGIIVTGFLLSTPVMSAAQQYAGAADLQRMLLTEYPLAGTTPDGTDVTAPGTVVVLQKDNFVMRTAIDNLFQVNGRGVASMPVANAYENGAIKQIGVSGFLAKMTLQGSGSDPQNINRRFQHGEQFWVIKIQSAADGVVFTLLSDPVDGQRYHATLKFPIAKNAAPPPEQVLATVAEVLMNATTPPEPAGPAPADPAATQSKTISIGQSKSQVQALFGAPARVANMAGKEIDFYPDMKVTFVKGKVTDISADSQ